MKKGSNPFRRVIQEMVKDHMMQVGREAIKPYNWVSRHLELMDGTVYEVQIRLVKKSQQPGVDPFAFPTIRRSRKGPTQVRLVKRSAGKG